MAGQNRPFLTATWRNLVLLSYEIDPEALLKYLPQGLSLDAWQGKCLISVVGLQFLNTRVRGIPAPIYRNYPEVNLRFYVRRKLGGQWRRGVVFIKQIVPHRMVALVARRVYHERFVAMPISCSLACPPDSSQPQRITYQWRHRRHWEKLEVAALGPLERPAEGSIEHFLAEHYWGYNTQPNGSTLEYLVDRPSWRIRTAPASTLVCDVEQLYGSNFVECLGGSPISSFWAEGSEVAVHRGVRI